MILSTGIIIFFFLKPQPLYAHVCSPGCNDSLPISSHCIQCPQGQCTAARNTLIEDHARGETTVLAKIRDEFHIHREWFVNTYLSRLFIPALMMMGQQMTSVAMMQMELVGEMFDAKLHLETQRLFNELQNEAAKDYQPSETFCWFGTNTRSLSHSELLSQTNQAALHKTSFDRQLAGINNAASDQQISEEMRSRWAQFVTDYCDPHDNNWLQASPTQTGLQPACGATGASNPARANIDIDFQRLVENKRTLNIDFRNNGLTNDEEDVIALSRNLYGHKPLKSKIPNLIREDAAPLYLELRSVAAKRAVAENSYNALVGLKSSGSAGGNSSAFLKSILVDLGMPNTEIDAIIGQNPSFYAQLEILGKKMFQNTDFFTDLYDKPANVKRKMAALNAIELMLDRAIYESEMRNELMMSVLLSNNLSEQKEQAFKRLSTGKK